MSSSTTNALSRQPLVQVLKNITDPRDRRGVRHDLLTVLSLAVTGVLAGCRSLTAIWEYATDLTAADLEALGLEEGQALPSESTIRRVLQDLDPAGLDALADQRDGRSHSAAIDKPTALFRIALALRSSRISFSSSLIRCAWSVVVPGRVPWSTWAFLTQERTASGRTPSSSPIRRIAPLARAGSANASNARPRGPSGYLLESHDSDPYLASLPPSNPGRFIAHLISYARLAPVTRRSGSSIRGEVRPPRRQQEA